MTNNQIWNSITEDEKNHLIKLLLKGERFKGIKYARSAGGLGLTEARDFVDSAWLCQQVAAHDPTRMSPKDEFRAEVLRVITNMLTTIGDPDMLVKDKYYSLTEFDVPKLFDLCMED